MRVSSADRMCLCAYTLSQFTKNNSISETRLDVIEIGNICSLQLVFEVLWDSYSCNSLGGFKKQ